MKVEDIVEGEVYEDADGVSFLAKTIIGDRVEWYCLDTGAFGNMLLKFFARMVSCHAQVGRIL